MREARDSLSAFREAQWKGAGQPDSRASPALPLAIPPTKRQSFAMANKTWFITGTSRGFGREWTIAALERGDRVAAMVRDSQTLADLRERFGDALLPLQLDVTDKKAATAAVAQAHAAFGRLDVVVNNAGFGLFGMIEEITEAEARAQMETNVFGALWVTQAALPFLRAQRSGHIIQVSSIGGITAFPGIGLYHASKWALEGFSQSLSAQVASFGIHVTLIEPGGYQTDWSGSSAVRANVAPRLRCPPGADYRGAQDFHRSPRGPAGHAERHAQDCRRQPPSAAGLLRRGPARASPRRTTRSASPPGKRWSRCPARRRETERDFSRIDGSARLSGVPGRLRTPSPGRREGPRVGACHLDVRAGGRTPSQGRPWRRPRLLVLVSPTRCGRTRHLTGSRAPMVSSGLFQDRARAAPG